jgi:hypothetical protein
VKEYRAVVVHTDGTRVPVGEYGEQVQAERMGKHYARLAIRDDGAEIDGVQVQRIAGWVDVGDLITDVRAAS